MITLAGPGAIYGTRTDASGGTPCNFGLAKSVSLDSSFTTKGLTGQWQTPIDFTRGEHKLSAKLKLAAFSPLAFMNLYWGVPSATGQTATQFMEAGTPTTNSYTVTQGATFVGMLEVKGQVDGKIYQQVASAPATGQYSVTALGVVSFATADNNPPCFFTYTYTAATGYKLVVTNQLQGFTPTFSIALFNTKNGKPVTYTIPFCTAEKLTRDFKENDFANPEIDILIGANAAGQIITESYAELS